MEASTSEGITKQAAGNRSVDAPSVEASSSMRSWIVWILIGIVVILVGLRITTLMSGSVAPDTSTTRTSAPTARPATTNETLVYRAEGWTGKVWMPPGGDSVHIQVDNGCQPIYTYVGSQVKCIYTSGRIGTLGDPTSPCDGGAILSSYMHDLTGQQNSADVRIVCN
jgi:hypothetical protein